MEILQIVPYLPPATSGVGDYAFLLAQELRASYGINTRFVVCDPASKGDELDRFRVESLREQRAKDLITRLNTVELSTCVILHYVGYGYQKRGCPIWLLSALRSWKNAGRHRKLVVMFHELYATGPVLSSAFWTSPLQKRIVRSFVLIADYCVTNRKESRIYLNQKAGLPSGQGVVLPVFSTVGEPEIVAPLKERKQRMIVFGSAGWRRQAYSDYFQSLKRACEQLEIEEVVDVGSPCEVQPSLPIRYIARGKLSALDVSKEMLKSSCGFFTYPAAYLGKSTIFAAYASHGLVPVTFGQNDAVNSDGLTPFEQYLPITDHPLSAATIDMIGQGAQEWYSEHKIEKQARLYAKLVLHA